MRSATARFLRYLQVERNASDLTIKSYREDLTALIEFLAGDNAAAPKPSEITPLDLRQYVSALHEAGYAKSSVARHLASLRSFFRFAQREGLAEQNPAKPLRNPRPDRKLPHFLTTRGNRPATQRTTARRADGFARPSDARNHLLGRTARQRAGGDQR